MFPAYKYGIYSSYLKGCILILFCLSSSEYHFSTLIFAFLLLPD